MDAVKTPLKSKTVIALMVLGLTMATKWLGIDELDEGKATEIATNVIEVVALLVAIYGRITASERLTK